MKLTAAQKAQREWYKQFGTTLATNVVSASLTQEGTEVTDVVIERLQTMFNGANTDTLTDAVAKAFADAGVDYKALQKVEKFLKQPETVAAMTAAQQVAMAVQKELSDLMDVVFSEETAQEA